MLQHIKADLCDCRKFFFNPIFFFCKCVNISIEFRVNKQDEVHTELLLKVQVNNLNIQSIKTGSREQYFILSINKLN